MRRQMISGSDATAAATAPSSGPAAPPQRQSCDRCHRQKLRCTRNKSNGDTCDRCLSKRAQCVYSSSLPKGRPSLRRLTLGGQSTGNSAPADDPTSPKEVTQPILTSGPSSSDATAPTVQPPVMDTTMDMSLPTWPWLGTASWDGTQPDLGWDKLNFSRSEVDDLLACTNNFDSDMSGREDTDLFSPTHSPSTPSPPSFRTYTNGQIGLGNYERQEGGVRNTMDQRMGGNATGVFPEKNPCAVIGQLSQLSVHLSTLRTSSHLLAQAVASSFGRGPSDGQSPLIDSAAFESVAAWLAFEESSANMDPRGSMDFPADISLFWPSTGPQMSSTPNAPNILRDVFSASHRLMEILRYVQADDITRHLVMACEALLLETYAAILTTLQHEAYPSDSMSTTALGNVRLVLVVQLCAYLIERQHQAVGQCLSPASAQKHNLPASLPSGTIPLGTTDRECLKDLKAQVQQKLTRLRQMLRCN